MGVKTTKVRNIDTLRASLKRGGGDSYLTRVPSDGSLVVRFLTEPTDWVAYQEHYDSIRKFYPCSDGCEGCQAGDRPSSRYLVNALVVSEDRVVPLVLPKTLAAMVVRKYDRYGTITDRNYELIRTGAGLDTQYELDPEMPSKIAVDRYDTLDLLETLEEQLSGPTDSGDSNGAASNGDAAGGAARTVRRKKRIVRR